MYIYSEKTNKKYDSVEACVEAEKAYDEQLERARLEKEKLTSERAARAKEVEDAYQKAVNARKEYDAVLEKFVEDYGSFHMSIHSGDMNPFNLHLLDWYFD